jgi:hypothetical protein
MSAVWQAGREAATRAAQGRVGWSETGRLMSRVREAAARVSTGVARDTTATPAPGAPARRRLDRLVDRAVAQSARAARARALD